LLGANGQIAFNGDDALTPFAGDARITYRIVQQGAYSILLSGSNGTQGAYTLTLRATPPSISTALTASTTINIPPGAPTQHYSITANPNGSTPITVQSLTAGFNFRAQLWDSNANTLALVNGGIEGATLTVPAGTATYELLVSSADPSATGQVEISLSGSTSSASTDSTDTSTSTTPPTEAPVSSDPANDPNACVISGANINIRRGPSTAFDPPIGSLNGDYNAYGRNNDWYVFNYNGVEGWVYGPVVNLFGGACGSLAFVQGPALPAPQTTEESQPPVQATPVYTPTTQAQATQSQATQPVVQATPSYTPTTAVQTAPIDNEPLDFQIHRDNGGSFSNSISYPEGDYRDRIGTEINLDQVNSSRTVLFTLSCSGTGTGNVTFHRGSPNAGSVACGQSISWRFAAPYRTEDFYVQIQSGSASYVNYTITATITGN